MPPVDGRAFIAVWMSVYWSAQTTANPFTLLSTKASPFVLIVLPSSDRPELPSAPVAPLVNLTTLFVVPVPEGRLAAVTLPENVPLPAKNPKPFKLTGPFTVCRAEDVGESVSGVGYTAVVPPAYSGQPNRE